ncbi:MAG: MGMT family protein [Acidimicrobiales bacterium]
MDADRFEQQVLEVIRRLRVGEVISYGEVAAEAGFPGRARAVGSLLRRGAVDVPWWRVVRADGRIVAPAGEEQTRRLRAEGVAVRDGRVRLPRARPPAR